MDADHVAHGATDGLGGHDDLTGQFKLLGDAPLELGEQQVGDRVRTSDEGAQATDVGGQHGPGVAGDGCHGLGHGQRHGGVVVGVQGHIGHAGTAEDGHQGHGGEERDGRGLHLHEGLGPGLLDGVTLHAVDGDGQDGDQHEGDGAGQVQVLNGGGHALVAEDVGEGDLLGGQDALEAQFGDTGHDQDGADEDVGQPSLELAHVGLELGGGVRGDGAGPFSIPGGLGTEIPGVLGYAESGLGAGHDDAQANETTDQGREFGADQPCEAQVRDQEGHGGEDAELPGAETFGPGLVLAEEAGQEAEHENGQDEDHGAVHHGGPLADDLGEGAEVDEIQTGGAGSGSGLDQRVEELQAHEDGRTDSTEGDREGVEDETDDRGCQGRKAQGEEQRSRQGRGRAESGRAFDEGREHVADDDGLDAFIAADALHAVLDGFHTARVLQGIQDDDGAEDNDENADGDDDTLQGKSRDVADGQVPCTDSAEGAHKPGQRHGFGGRPAHADHQDESNQDGQQCHHCQDRN